MKGNFSALYSMYIIDGVRQQLTPAEILNDCLRRPEAGKAPRGGKVHDAIVDESADPDLATFSCPELDVQDCLEKTSGLAGRSRTVPMAYSKPFTISRITGALLDAVWKKGHFRLSDLALAARWRWNPLPVGNMAAFFASAEAVSDFLGSLGICLSGYSFCKSEAESSVAFKVSAAGVREASEDVFSDAETDGLIDLEGNSPFGSEHPVIRKSRALPETLADDPESWLIYVPFDSCDFRLGHSLACEAAGQSCDKFPDLGDGDYFIDCYEVIREFVEDGVVLSGATVGDGGLLTALKRMCAGGVGAAIDINGIMEAYGEKSSQRVLFSEIPGVIIQIRDSDYDYSDAEFLLQDIAYYPIGHPLSGTDRVEIKSDGQNGISGILQSLLNGQASEGED